MNKLGSITIKYPKGSIWWIDDSWLPIGVHIEKKNRPVVIVSNNARGLSTVVEVCTITSADKSDTCNELNVPFRNWHGHINYIQANQHFTVDVKYLSNYEGQLSEHAILKLNSALRNVQDLGDLFELESEISRLNRTINSFEYKSADRRKLKTSVKYLDSLIDEIQTVISNINYTINSNESIKTDKKSDTRRKYIKFTPDTMLEYMCDMDDVDSGKLSEKEFMTKWSIPDMKKARRKLRYIDSKLSN